MGFFDDIGKAIGGAAKAVAAGAGEVVKAAQNSVVVQGAAAVATGGLSIVAQAAYEGISGNPGPIGQATHDVLSNPGKVAMSVPGMLINETPAFLIAATAVKAGSATLGSATGQQWVSDIGKGTDKFQQYLRDDPVASVKIIGGTALLASGAGTGPGIAMLGSGVADALSGAFVPRNGAIQPAAPGRPPPPVDDAKPTTDTRFKPQAPPRVTIERDGILHDAARWIEDRADIDIPGFGHGK